MPGDARILPRRHRRPGAERAGRCAAGPPVAPAAARDPGAAGTAPAPALHVGRDGGRDGRGGRAGRVEGARGDQLVKDFRPDEGVVVLDLIVDRTRFSHLEITEEHTGPPRHVPTGLVRWSTGL